MSQQERVRETLRGYDTADLMSLVSCINSYDGGLDDQTWLPADEFNIADWLTDYGRSIDSGRLSALLYSARTGEFSERHDYWRVDEYGYPVSTDYPSYDIDEIAEYIVENSDDLREWCLSSYMEDDLEAALEEDEDDRENTTESDTDADTDVMTSDEVRDVLADWLDEQARPAEREALDELAQRCVSTRAPMDPADVIGWAESPAANIPT